MATASHDPDDYIGEPGSLPPARGRRMSQPAPHEHVYGRFGEDDPDGWTCGVCGYPKPAQPDVYRHVHAFDPDTGDEWCEACEEHGAQQERERLRALHVEWPGHAPVISSLWCDICDGLLADPETQPSDSNLGGTGSGYGHSPMREGI